MQPPSRADSDSPWKEILERYFKEFMEFFFPTAYEGIDWARGHEFLDKELQKIVRKAEVGRKVVDKLVKVFTTDGTETWVVVHVEVQGQYEADFAKRMFVYYYRLFDRYDRDIVSLAVLTDSRKRWKPKQFHTRRWGCEVRFTFPRVKLLEYSTCEDELEASRNPFAVVVLAYLKTQSTRRDSEDRLQWKLRLCKLLYARGYSKEDVVELMRFIDWVMELSPTLEKQFDEAVLQYEEEHRMKYITSFERHGIKKGMQQGQLRTLREGIMDILHVRFEDVPAAATDTLNTIDDVARLQQLHRDAVTVSSVEAFLAMLPEAAVPA